MMSVLKIHIFYLNKKHSVINFVTLSLHRYRQNTTTNNYHKSRTYDMVANNCTYDRVPTTVPNSHTYMYDKVPISCFVLYSSVRNNFYSILS